jgi:hypothetical protein
MLKILHCGAVYFFGGTVSGFGSFGIIFLYFVTIFGT